MSPPDALVDALAEHGVRVLHADPVFMIVDKPAGLPSQRTRAGEPGLIELLWQAGWTEAALHHRLDRPASGCLALGLDPSANPGLAAAFRTHTARRIYRVVLMGRLEGPAAWTRALEGREARTDVQVLGAASGFTAAEIRLHTGRTHQIRRHAAMSGHPVAGDRRYGAEAGRAWTQLALHAARLVLPHPLTGAPVEAAASLPPELQPLWRLAGGP